jgi:hypothetical protein
MLDEVRAVVERSRSQALAVARGDLLNDLASDLAKGLGPFGERTVSETPYPQLPRRLAATHIRRCRPCAGARAGASRRRRCRLRRAACRDGYLSAVSGVSLAEIRGGERRMRRILLPAFVFWLSLTVVFVALGMTATGLGSVLSDGRGTLDKVAAP